MLLSLAGNTNSIFALDYISGALTLNGLLDRENPLYSHGFILTVKVRTTWAPPPQVEGMPPLRCQPPVVSKGSCPGGGSRSTSLPCSHPALPSGAVPRAPLGRHPNYEVGVLGVPHPLSTTTWDGTCMPSQWEAPSRCSSCGPSLLLSQDSKFSVAAT